ncbi:MAG: S41 family peptidase [Mariniblastus sp.]
MNYLRFLLLFQICFLLAGDEWSLAQVQPSVGMMRNADVSATNIVFVYGDDLWIVDRDGGMARPLASPPGEELQPRFSPDGQQIAFVGNYDGGRDIYTIGVEGGAVERLTYHPSREKLCDWTPDGESVLYSSGGFSDLGLDQLFTISLKQPVPKKLPLHEGAMGAIHADGKWLAFLPQNSRDHRTWKRYRGGMANDIWLFHLEDHTSKQITDFEGTDSQPMWHGDVLYYVSDAGPAHRINIWSYDSKSGERRQVTNFKDFDCKWPAIGPGPTGNGEIVLQNGSQLFLVDLATDKASSVSISVPGDRPNIRSQRYDASDAIEYIGISSTGKRAFVGARGDIWSLPAKNGSPRNLSKTDSINERFPAWSPDGKSIAFFADTTGEYELYVMPANGRGEAIQLTKGNTAFLNLIEWSPDSKRIAIADNAGVLSVHTIDSKETKKIDASPTTDWSVSWSHDSKWLTYAKTAAPDLETGVRAHDSIWVANVEDGTLRQLTDDKCNDMGPVFDRVGDFIYFYSNRGINNPKYSDSGDSWIYSGTEVLIALPLREDVAYPLALKSDEEEFDDEKSPSEAKKKDKSKDESDQQSPSDVKGESDDDADDDADEKSESVDDKKEDKKAENKNADKPKPLKIDFDNIERRAFALPVKQGFFGTLVVNSKNQLIYNRVKTDGGDEEESIKILDLAADEVKEKTILEDATRFAISADGKKLLIFKVENGIQIFIVDAASDQKLEKQVSKSGMSVVVDPRAQWRQIFVEAWRLERQFFYDPNMHGVDWQAVREHYEPMLKDCVSRRDLSFIIREMISELNVGHSYYREADLDNGSNSQVGLLGLRFDIDSDAFRVTNIVEGSASDTDARNAFRTAGGKVGDYLLAINGEPLTTDVNPYQALDGLAGQTISVTVSDDPKLDAKDRQLLLKPLRDTGTLRYRQFVEANRKRVEEKSQGKVGYIHVPNTGTDGQSELARQFSAQRHLPALIIDERWNSGGQIPTRFIELLNRPAVGYFATRTGATDLYPENSHQGPKCMLINGMAGSGGDMFPYLFKQAGLGKLIGTRTWGGLVGISGIPRLIDGAEVTAPGFAFYELDGTWGIEGHGVDPDIKVVADPSKTFDGGDPQLDTGIEQMLKELEENTFKIPPVPNYPDRSKMGISVEDK